MLLLPVTTAIADTSPSFLFAKDAKELKNATPMTMLNVSQMGFKSTALSSNITVPAENARRKPI